MTQMNLDTREEEQTRFDFANQPDSTSSSRPTKEGSKGSVGSRKPNTQRQQKNSRASVEPQSDHNGFQGSDLSWLPRGFKVGKDGKIFYRTGESEDEWKFLCSKLAITAMTRDCHNNSWGRLVVLTDPDGNTKQWAVPMKELGGDGVPVLSELLNMGADLATDRAAKNALKSMLMQAQPIARVRCVDTLGWHTSVFMRPDGPIGASDAEQLVWQTAKAQTDNRIRTRGTLEEWQQDIGRIAVGNSRLVLAISAALAAPMLQPLGLEGGFLHFVGASSQGKTCALRAAGSVCGGGGPNNEYHRPWTATANALEMVAAMHNDGLICLDEMGMASGDDVRRVAYTFTNGTGKARLTSKIELRPRLQWTILGLSTGEVNLPTKIGESRTKSRTMAGQLVRFVDVRADAGVGLGIFEKLHEFDSAALLAEHIEAASRKFYGTALRAFQEQLVSEDWQEQARCMVAKVVNTLAPDGADGQIRRVAQRFAIIAAAGELAIQWGILPWAEGEAQKAAISIFQDWISDRGGTGPAEIRQGLDALRLFLEQYATSRFQRWKDHQQIVQKRVGWIKNKGPNVEMTEYHIYPDTLSEEILRGHNAKLIIEEVKRRGHLKVNSDGRPTIKSRLPDGTQKRMYVVLSSFLEDTDHDPLPSLAEPGNPEALDQGSTVNVDKNVLKQKDNPDGTFGTHGTLLNNADPKEADAPENHEQQEGFI